MKLGFRYLIYSVVAVLLLACDANQQSQKPYYSLKLTQLENIKKQGYIKVLTRFGSTTYYEDAHGFSGLEYDLISLFAEHLQVNAVFVVPDTFESILEQISSGSADIAAAGLTVTESRRQKMRFAPSYHKIHEQIIYRAGRKRPKTIKELESGITEVVKGTSHIETLKQQQLKNPQFSWEINNELDSDGLLYLVNEGLIDYTVADSTQISLIQRLFPKLRVAFDISSARHLAWALSLSEDNSLYDEVIKFFAKITKDKTLNTLLKRHYQPSNQFNYVDFCTFRLHKKTRLPVYRPLFEAAAKKYDMDWRMLAAISYQESHWNIKAVSATGVRGLMMLTRDTAKLMGIKNRVDPKQSIDGGTRFFKRRLKVLAESIKDPDRTWMALAAYNIGHGHLEDARILTRYGGGNYNKWQDVKQFLPHLSKRKWYSRTKFGYARGREPVTYVKNIRSYYNLLVLLDEEERIQTDALLPPETQTAEEANTALPTLTEKIFQ